MRRNKRTELCPDVHKEIKSGIERRLREKMNGERPLVGPELVCDIADWGLWMSDRGASAGTDDWHVEYLQWALRGRCREFALYCWESMPPKAHEALEALYKVYNFTWPHNASCGYIFHAIWGWLQLELEKPGEAKPPSVQEQMAHLEKVLGEQGVPILRWDFDGFGGVRAITGEFGPGNGTPGAKEEAPRDERELLDGLRGEVADRAVNELAEARRGSEMLTRGRRGRDRGKLH